MIVASSKTKKRIKYLEKKAICFLFHLEFLENKHRCMKVIDAKGGSTNLLPHVTYHVPPNFQIEIAY
jgi:hypothetical protein